MKNRNGFTLVEMIAIITVLAIILLISLPALSSTLKSNEEKNYNNYLEDLYMATENYVTSKSFPELNNLNGGIFVSVKELINNGYVKSDKNNPKTKEAINPNSVIRVIKNNEGLFEYKYCETDCTTKAYSQENLIIHYDAYTRPEIKGTSIVWPDISGNDNYATMQGTNMEDCYSNGAVITNSNNPYFSKELNTLLTNTSDYTIELVYKAYGSADNTVLLANRTYGHWYYDVYTDGMVRTMSRNTDGTLNNWPAALATGLEQQNVLNNFALTNKYNGSTIDFQYYGNGKKLITDGGSGSYHTNTELVVIKPIYIQLEYMIDN